MKKTLIALFSTVGFLASFSFAYAETIYFSDFQTDKIYWAGTQPVFGNFAVSEAHTIDTGAVSVLFYNGSSTPITFSASPQMGVATIVPTSNVHASILLTTCNGQTIPAYSLLVCTGTVGGQNGNTQWLPGFTYYIYGDDDQTTDVGLQLISDSTRTLFSGFITDGGGIEPGWVPGISQIGVATSSVATFCNTNFATSSGGFLASVGQDISLGLCKVTSFLFVPNQNTLNQWQTLASTTVTKIPFSYVYEVYADFRTLSATTTENLPTYTADLTSLTLGSTTSFGNVLPNLSILSQSTISTYLPAGIHDALFLLARSAIWLFVVLSLYRRIVPHKAKI